MSRKKPKKIKGKIVCDECTPLELAKAVIEGGFSPIFIKKSDKGTRLTDNEVARKYGKGTYPIYTEDGKFIKHNDKDIIPVGLIIWKAYSKPQFNNYYAKTCKFFTKIKIRELKRRKWIIPGKGDPTFTKLP